MKSDLYVTGKRPADRLLRNDGTALLIGFGAGLAFASQVVRVP